VKHDDAVTLHVRSDVRSLCVWSVPFNRAGAIVKYQSKIERGEIPDIVLGMSPFLPPVKRDVSDVRSAGQIKSSAARSLSTHRAAAASLIFFLKQKECGCCKKNANAAKRMRMPRKECGCYKKNAVAAKRMRLPRKECGCREKNAVSTKRMRFLQKDYASDKKNAGAAKGLCERQKECENCEEMIRAAKRIQEELEKSVTDSNDRHPPPRLHPSAHQKGPG